MGSTLRFLTPLIVCIARINPCVGQVTLLVKYIDSSVPLPDVNFTPTQCEETSLLTTRRRQQLEIKLIIINNN